MKVRSATGDAFLAAYAEAGSARRMLETSERARRIVRGYRERLPETTNTDEEIVDIYAKFLASCPGRGGLS